jgi:hypothetical protein
VFMLAGGECIRCFRFFTNSQASERRWRDGPYSTDPLLSTRITRSNLSISRYSARSWDLTVGAVRRSSIYRLAARARSALEGSKR